MNKLKILSAAIALLAVAPHALADERETLETLRQTTMNLIDALVENGILTRDKADTLVQQAEKKAAAKVARSKPETTTVRVPYIPESVRNEIREQLKQEVLAQARTEQWAAPNAIPDWVSRIKWEGDIRVRYQMDRIDDVSSPFILDVAKVNAARTLSVQDPFLYATGGELNDDRGRLRLRARLGMLAKVTDQFDVGVRLSTGNTSDPVSTNQTLGNSFNKNSLVLDRGYVQYRPVDTLRIYGGRMPNPWLSTDLVWDADLNFDGVALQYAKEIGLVRPFATAGIFPLGEVAENDDDKWLYGAQAGVDWQPSTNLRGRFGLAYYHYKNILGRTNPTVDVFDTDHTAPSFVQKGNSVFNIRNTTALPTDANGVLFGLASEYHLLNLTGAVDMANFEPVHVMASFDYVKNLGFDRSEVSGRVQSNVDDRDTGYQVNLTVGMPKFDLAGNWQLSLGYRYLEGDAVLDAFADSDWHLGGTNHRGFMLGSQVAVDRNAVLGLRWLSTREIDGPPLRIDVLQADMNLKY